MKYQIHCMHCTVGKNRSLWHRSLIKNILSISKNILTAKYKIKITSRVVNIKSHLEENKIYWIKTHERMVNQKSVKNKAVLLSWLIDINNCLCQCHWVTFLQNSNDLDLIKLKVLRVLETLKKQTSLLYQ